MLKLRAAYMWFRRITAVSMFVLVAVPAYQFWWPALATLNPEWEIFGGNGCGEPCVVTYNPGGSLAVFMMMANQLHRNERLLVIDGKCYSACALMADLARPHVCVTKQAMFGFHKAFGTSKQRRFDPPQSIDVAAWVSAYGGFPVDDTLDMEFEEAVRYWDECTPTRLAAL